MLKNMLNEYRYNYRFRRTVDDYVERHKCTVEEALEVPEVRYQYNLEKEL